MKKRQHLFVFLITMAITLGVCFYLTGCGAGAKLPRSLSKFVITGIGNVAVVDYNMPVTITAIDDENEVFTEFSEYLSVKASNQSLTPILQISGFSNGVAAGTLRFIIDNPDNLPVTTTIIVSSGNIQWTSSEIQVEAERFESFSVTAPSSIKESAPFSIQIKACNQIGGIYTGYSGTVDLTTSNIDIRFPSLPLTTPPLSNGELTITNAYLQGQGSTEIQAFGAGRFGLSGTISVLPWTHGIQVVASEWDVGMGSSLAANGNNNYISYSDNTNSVLRLATKPVTGVEWGSGLINTIGDGGYSTSLAVDGSNIYVSYIDSLELKLAQKAIGGWFWIIETVDSVYFPDDSNCLAVDASNIYISYSDCEKYLLKFAQKTITGGEEAWVIETVNVEGDVGFYTSLAVDANNIYINYYDATSSLLKLAQKPIAEGTWNTETIDPLENVGERTSIAVDGTNVYISYTNYIDEQTWDLKFAQKLKGGESWNTETVDSGGRVGMFPSLAVDGSSIYISYFDYSNQDLKFAKKTIGGVTWSIKTVDSIGDVGWDTSIAVDGTNVYISYYDWANKDLRFAKSIDGGETW